MYNEIWEGYIKIANFHVYVFHDFIEQNITF